MPLRQMSLKHGCSHLSIANHNSTRFKRTVMSDSSWPYAEQAIAACAMRGSADPARSERDHPDQHSHDGASGCQMLAGVFRFVCCNGLVVGDVVDDIRIQHKGNIQGEVIEGAFRVLDEFEAVRQHTEAMKALQLERSNHPKRSPSRPQPWRC
jgi:hypothetical protein